MNDEYQSMAANAICHAASMVQEAWRVAASEYERPCVVFKPQLIKDGSHWCALFGENMQEGVAAFGKTPAEAMYAFDQAWRTLETSGARDD